MWADPGSLNAVNRRYVRMVERREDFGFPLEASQPFRGLGGEHAV